MVYFCPSLPNIQSEIYHATNPPPAPVSTEQSDALRQSIYHNVQRLLDEDQGNYEQGESEQAYDFAQTQTNRGHSVFVSSHANLCLEQLGLPSSNCDYTVVLLDPGCSMDEEKAKGQALVLLRMIAQVRQQPVSYQRTIPFLLVTAESWSGKERTSAAALAYINEGLVDVVSSPFSGDQICGIVGHVKHIMRPSATALGAGMTRHLARSIHDTSKPQCATHRPDLILSSERRAAVRTAIAGWGFPAHDLNMDELTYGAMVMMEHVLQNPELQAFRLPRAELVTFILATRRLYKHENEVYYHNWRHAVDVTQSLYCFLWDIRLLPPTPSQPTSQKQTNAAERLLTPIDAFILLVAALGHDVGHPGVNNAFLVACNHNLAHLFNDKSVLENYHCSAYSQILRRYWPSLFRIPRFRSTVISTILATDMQRHFEYMGQLGDLKQKISGADVELSTWTDKDKEHAKELIMALLIKAADISNVARPFDISAQWARVLMDEFARQGELEAELKIPTCLFGGPPNKEDLLAAAQSQKGFMSLFGYPLFFGISEVMTNVSCTLVELDKNKEIWDRKISDELARREAQDNETKSPPTYDVPKQEVKEARIRNRMLSEPAPVPTELPQTPSRETRREAAIDASGSPVRHPGSEQRLQFALGASPSDHKRASAPLLSVANDVSLSPGGTSRRSSKDVALGQLHEYSAFAHLHMKQNLSNIPQGGSRRGSADAGWSVHQSYPSSRRGSKDESLTTILVTSQPGQVARSVPGSPVKASKASSSSKCGSVGTRSAHAPKHSLATQRSSQPSSRSQTVSSGTATTGQHSPSTQPSSIAPTDDEATPPAVSLSSNSPANEDPFLVPGNWPGDVDGEKQAAIPEHFPTSPSTPVPGATKSESPRVVARVATDTSDDIARIHLGKSETTLRESRSRSRLRGLKFWRKRRDPTGLENTSGESSP